MKKIVISFVICFLLIGANLFAQSKVTQFGVIDTARVYQTYFRESSAVRNYEKKKNDFQTEINRQSEALEKLQSKKDTAIESTKL